MNDKPFEVNDIIVQNIGYSMILYKFYRVIRISDKSIWIQELKSKVTDARDCFRPWVIAGDAKTDEPIRRISKNTYIGSKWDGQPVQEDHLD